MIFIQIGEVYK